jgi:hypothetical protein
MPFKLSLLPNPSKDFTTIIDWSDSNTHYTSSALLNLTITFNNAVDGARITAKIANIGTSTMSITWPLGVFGADTSIAAGTTKIITLTKIKNATYATLENTCNTSKTFTTSGTFTVPTGVTKAIIYITPSTGGGASATNPTTYPNVGISGGGGGYAANTTQQISVTPGLTYAVNVGAAGTAGSSSNGGNGGTTTITQGASTLVSVAGGQGGLMNGQAGLLGGSGINGGVNPFRTSSIGGTGGTPGYWWHSPIGNYLFPGTAPTAGTAAIVTVQFI